MFFESIFIIIKSQTPDFQQYTKYLKIKLFSTNSQSIEKNARILAPKFRNYKTNGKEMFREVLRIN